MMMTGKSMKHSIQILFAVILTIHIIPSIGMAQNTRSSSTISLNFGFPKFVLPEINERDAEAAMKLWTSEIITKHQFNYEGTIFIYPDIDELTQAMVNGQINIAPIPAIDYLRWNKSIRLYPAVLAKIYDSVLDRFVLLVRKDSQVTRIRELRDKLILLKQESSGSTLNTWLEVILHEAGLPQSHRFFSEIQRKDRESQLIFPLLLKKADCCIITEGAFQTMRELNPQLEVQLIPLVKSDSLLISNIFVYTQQLNEEARDKVTLFAMNWEESKATEQIQTIFRFNGLVPFEESYLENTQSLLRRYDRIQ